jgi:aminoglycoside phosphotransferase (APT) family kinase protein
MPADEWAAEVAVDHALVRRVLASQFPELELGSLRLLGDGWDNSVWLVDERFVFRFPRREIAVAPGEREVVLLPRLAPLLPLPVPEPVFVGQPDDDFPWPFFGAPMLPGREAARIALDDDRRGRAAGPLARFLRALHDPALLELDGVEALPHDPTRRADSAYRSLRMRERADELRRLELWDAPAALEAVLAEAESLPSPTGRAVVHGDLHLRHLLVSDGGEPTAVIDWDDLCVADPSIDLMLYWSHLPPTARAAFRDVYPATEEQLLRARVLSLFLCGSLAVYGRHEGLPALEREAIAGIERTLAV